MALQEHPVLRTMRGFQFRDARQTQLAFLTYLDLCEGKGCWNVKVHACDQLQLVFLSGHASRNKPREIVLPLSLDVHLSHSQIQKYIHSVTLPDYTTGGLILAICSPDSSTVYYKVSDGLIMPECPEMSEWKLYLRQERPDAQRNHRVSQTAMYIENKTPGNFGLQNMDDC